MAGTLSDYGWKDIDWSFGLENNQLISTFYLADATQLEAVLGKLFGTEATGNIYLPMPHPRFSTFFATDVNIKDLAVIGNDNGNTGWLSSIQAPENIRGLNLTVTFKPMLYGVTGYGSAQQQYGIAAEEEIEFSAQIMSVLSNTPAKDNKHCMQWSGGAMGGKPCSNMRGIQRTVPKTTIIQKRILSTAPPQFGVGTQGECIGCVNQDPYKIIGLDSNNTPTFDAGCVLASALPARRRFRFDGLPCWEYSMKYEIFSLVDIIEDGTNASVTWQRLYNNDNAPPCWNKVVYNDGTPLYRTINMNQFSASGAND